MPSGVPVVGISDVESDPETYADVTKEPSGFVA